MTPLHRGKLRQGRAECLGPCHLYLADEVLCPLSQPQDLEAPPEHTFEMTSFKKVKACGICRQAITRQGSTCRGELGAWAHVWQRGCTEGGCRTSGDALVCLHVQLHA